MRPASSSSSRCARRVSISPAHGAFPGGSASAPRKAGIPVVLDADTPALGIDSLLREVDFPIVSREFAERHFGTRRPADFLRGLAALGARFPVVTLGGRGAIAGG